MRNSNLPEKENEIKTWLGQFIQDLNTIKLPEIIERNLVRSVSKLITGFIEIPTTYLNEFKRRIERETEAKDLISSANAEDIVEFNRKDREFIASSANYYSIQQFKEAGYRRAVLEKAISELGDSAILEDAKEEIDEDWLSRFAKIANDVSKEDVQLILAKILAGEISKPGSFSTMTLKVIERFDKRAALQFMLLSSQICTFKSHSSIIIITTENMNHGGLIRRQMIQHYLSEQLNPNEYPRIEDYSLLVDLGVLRPFQVLKSIPCMELAKFKIGSTSVELKSDSQLKVPLSEMEDKKFKCLELTTAGSELLPFIKQGECPDDYLQKLDIFFVRHISRHIRKGD